nr:hypothetical protein [Tanacetum cinerariifolium]
DALGALGVASSNADSIGKGDARKRIPNALVNGERPGIVKAAEVDQRGVDTLVLQDVDRVEGRVRLPYRGQNLAGGLQNI